MTGYRRRDLGRIANRLVSPLYLDLNGDYRASVFLAGSGRGGTTWASEVINHRNEYRYVFEPLHPHKVRLCRGFRWRQYLRPDDRREEFLEPVEKILSGRVRSLWTDRFHRRFVARRRLIKDVRAHLLLGWMRANFPEMPIVFMLRHPCAVVASKMQLGWEARLEETVEQPELIEDFLEPFIDEIRGARTDFERHVFLWCVENYVPLRQFSRGEIHLLFYENLCESPDVELGSLFSFLGRAFDEEVLKHMRRPSPLSREGSAVVAGGRLADSWRGSVTGPQARRAREILGIFGLDAIYGEGAMPDPGGAYALMGSGDDDRRTLG